MRAVVADLIIVMFRYMCGAVGAHAGGGRGGSAVRYDRSENRGREKVRNLVVGHALVVEVLGEAAHAVVGRELLGARVLELLADAPELLLEVVLLLLKRADLLAELLNLVPQLEKLEGGSLLREHGGAPLGGSLRFLLGRLLAALALAILEAKLLGQAKPGRSSRKARPFHMSALVSHLSKIFCAVFGPTLGQPA